MLLTAVAGIAQAESISVADTELTPGSQATLVINCDITSDDITAYQFDLYLPDGVTLAKNNKGRYASDATFVLSERHDGHTASLKDNGGFVRFVVSQNDKYTIASGSGELLRVIVDVADTYSGGANGEIKNFIMSEVNQTKHYMSDIAFALTVPSSEPTLVQATGVSLDMGNATLTRAGETLQLTATVEPDDATNKSVTWASSDTDVATVDENGLVTAVANGIANITATTTDGTNHSATCVVTVNIDEVVPVEHEYVTDLAQLSNYKLYTLTCERGQMVLKADGTGLAACYAYENQHSRTDFTEAEAQFAILTIDEKHYLYSPYLSRFFTNENTFNDAQGSAITFDASYAYDDYLWVMTSNNAVGTLLWMNMNNNGGVNLDTWTIPDGGNRWRIEAVADFNPEEALAAFQVEFGAIVFSETYYLYNIDADMFLNKGNSYGTHAVLAEDGLPVRIGTTGYHTYIYIDNGDGTERLMFRESGGNDSKIYVDGSGSGNGRQHCWTIINDRFGTFVIKAEDHAGEALYLGNIPTRDDYDDQNRTSLDTHVDIVSNATESDNIHWMLWPTKVYEKRHSAGSTLKGDLNGDGEVDILDATIIVYRQLGRE